MHSEHFRHAHAAELGIARQTDPATFDIGVVGRLETFGSGDLAGMPLRALLVAAAVERGDQLAGDLGGFFENGVGGIGIHMIGKCRQPGPQCRGLEDFVQDKAHIAQGSIEFRHE